MPTCTRPGCGVQFDPATPSPCAYHSGAPVFHEGLKSWSCCRDVNKPVLDFDDFVKIKGCTTAAQHTNEKLAAPKPAIAPESHVNAAAAQKPTPVVSEPTPTPPPVSKKEIPPEPKRHAAPTTEQVDAASKEPQQDPDGVEIPAGSKCKRTACNAEFIPGMARSDDECIHHPGETEFHEGSKGYTCCKRRVLEFDEFLRIQGCAKGRHLFIGSKDSTQNEQPKLRIDFYQMQKTVTASIFGKNADKEKSSVRFEPWDIHVDLHLPNNQRYHRSIPLYGPIDPEESSYKIFGTKCEITLKKADSRSWASLEPSNIQAVMTFGISGGAPGSVGGKEMVLDEANRIRRS